MTKYLIRDLLKTKSMKKFNLLIFLIYFSLNLSAQFFTKLPDSKLNNPPEKHYKSVCWGDYDNDNDLDLIVTGANSYAITTLYTNVGNDSFIVANFNIPNISNGVAKFFDFDNDNDLDIFISGNGPSPNIYFTAIYKNTLPDSSNFIKLTTSTYNIPQAQSAAAHIADLDNDGDIDIMLSGRFQIGNFTYYATYINTNQNGSGFTNNYFN